MSPRTREQTAQLRQERRRQILDAACQLFAEKGFAATRVSDIAARADVSQGTVYWYFESKGDLYQAAIMHYMDTFMEPVYQVITRQELSPEARLMAIAETTLNMLNEATGFMMLFFQAISTPDTADLLTHRFKDIYRRWIDMCVPLFQAIGDPEPKAAAQLFFCVLDALMLQYILDPGLLDREQLLAAIKQKFNL
jgi:AcrR family transcriptional regulator